MSAPDRDEVPPPPQFIPRPASTRPGPPSPWEHLPIAERTGLSLPRVLPALTNPVDFAERSDGHRRHSSVLAALFDESGETRVILTRRASTLRSHRSEVSFPGGRVDAGEGLVAAALREADEEVGIDPASVEVIGTLSPLVTYSSAALIHPFIGVLPSRPSLRVNAAEVERAFDATLAELLADGVHRTERWAIGEVERNLHFFDLPGDIVWGATARLLWEMLARVTGTVTEPTPEDGPLP